MDLSGIIFVVLAIGWAAYLLPMALRRHDDASASRPVETFSDQVRVVRRPGSVESSEATSPPVEAPAPRRHTVTRESARRAAKRRRQVLAVLLVGLLAVAGTSYFGYTPWWSTAIPAGLIVTFLIVARVTVRAQQVRREAVAPAAVESAPARPAARPATPVAEVEPDLGREDTMGLSRDQLADAVAAPVMDDGGLWDPLPITLPTYVHKARAHRTVRTIELTGMTSSGHDPADTELARQADEARVDEAQADEAPEAEQRKAAGA